MTQKFKTHVFKFLASLTPSVEKTMNLHVSSKFIKSEIEM